jgi:hypothetical protein
VGDQISGILQRAHETAEEITAQSRSEAEDRLEQARVESAEIAARAAQRVRDLDADTDRIWIERHRIVDDARDLASQLLALAETAADRFPDDNEPAPDAPFDAAESAAGAFDDEPEAVGGPEAGASEELYADEADEETEREAANEEEDDVLTDEAPEDDVEATRAFTAQELEQREDDPTAQREDDTTAQHEDDPAAQHGDDPTEQHGSPRQEALPPPGESRRSAIPPASQAANRRQSQ